MSIMVGRISYLPENELRTQRLTASRTQLEWLNTLFSYVRISSVCQNYRDFELPNGNSVKNYLFKQGIGAGPARNIILKEFYESDYDWLFLLDDDTIAYPYYRYEDFIHEVADNPDKFKGIDAISAVEPEYHPYKKQNYEDLATRTHYKFEPRELNSGSATSLIRNIKKYYGKALYFPDIDANKGEGREDMEFLFAWLKEGLTWYTMDTWVRKSLCFDKSSIFGYNVKERDAILMKCLDVICERYSADGITRDVNGKITWKNFNTLFNKSQKLLYIERNEKIDFSEEVTPKQKQTSKKLF